MDAIDSSVLSLLINPNADVPANPKTGKHVERASDRVDQLIEALEASRTKLLIPVPVLAEILVLAAESGPEHLAEFESSAVYRIGNFDTRSAVEAAAMELDAKKGGDKKGGSESDWQRVKVDRQIVAIAKANGCKSIYTNDDGLKTLAEKAGIKALGVWDLPEPPAKQMGFEDSARDGNE